MTSSEAGLVSEERPNAIQSRIGRSGLSLGTLCWWLFVVLWLIGFADVSGDYAVFSGTPMFSPDDPVPVLNRSTQTLSVVLIGLLAMLGCRALLRGRTAFRASPEIKLFLLLFVLSTAFGVLVGLSKGLPLNYVIGDSQNLVTYAIVFAVGGISPERRVEDLRRLFLIGGAILLFKLFYSFGAHLTIWGSFSWRSLLKQSNFFVPMTLVTSAWVLYGKRARVRRRYAVLALLAALGVFAAQARGLFLGAAAGIAFFGFVTANHKRFHRLLLLGLVVMFVALIAGAILQGDLTKSFGYWEPTDQTFAPSFDFRIRQIDALLGIFGNNWLAGAGLGYYDPTYEGYEEWLPRPYLHELEYLNLLAKLGVIGMGLWIGAFLSLFVGCIRAARQAIDLEHRGFLIGLTAGLLGLMVASSVQTGYSSVYFHLYVVLVLLVLSEVRRARVDLRPSNSDKRDHASTT